MSARVVVDPETRAAALARAQAGELLGPLDMAAILGVSRAHFYTLNGRGALDALKVRPAIGSNCFSGVLVARYVAGEALYVPSFGRKRA